MKITIKATKDSDGMIQVEVIVPRGCRVTQFDFQCWNDHLSGSVKVDTADGRRRLQVLEGAVEALNGANTAASLLAGVLGVPGTSGDDRALWPDDVDIDYDLHAASGEDWEDCHETLSDLLPGEGDGVIVDGEPGEGKASTIPIIVH